MVSDYSQYAWLVPLFPLAAFLILLAVGRTMGRASAYIGMAATLASLVLSILVFLGRMDAGTPDYTWNDWTWIQAGSFQLQMGFEVNNLNALMLVIVTLVSFLVNMYSAGYMKDDDRISVFYSYIALFTFSMLGLVISENLLQLYIFWELVGVCSFLLVGFWYFKPEAKAAAKKAFIVTRIGDVGLFLAILLLYWYMPEHTLDFSSIQNVFSSDSLNSEIPGYIVTTIAILIFVGAVGKSGQFPLHTWLPDAMEGPTPISALIHAATMVAAGVYLVARVYPVFMASDAALDVVLWIGAFTAIFAALIALTQTDIKRILAYSTVSQLGYMMFALGMGTQDGYVAGIFHLYTHAFFKALLFLGAGSVIHALHEQNIFKMGGLFGKMKATGITFAIGMLALSGIVPLSGFFSKDAILTVAYHEAPIVFVVGLVTAFLTAFYMARLFFSVFTGKSKSEHEAHESPAVMTIPLWILAVLAVVAGYVYMPGNAWFFEWLTGNGAEEHVNMVVMVLSTLVAVGGLLLGYVMYGKKSNAPAALAAKLAWAHRLSNRKFYVDELYAAAIVKPVKGLGILLQMVDEFIVDGAVRLTTKLAFGFSKGSATVQNGQVQTYGVITLLGVVILTMALVGWRFM